MLSGPSSPFGPTDERRDLRCAHDDEGLVAVESAICVGLSFLRTSRYRHGVRSGRSRLHRAQPISFRGRPNAPKQVRANLLKCVSTGLAPKRNASEVATRSPVRSGHPDGGGSMQRLAGVILLLVSIATSSSAQGRGTMPESGSRVSSDSVGNPRDSRSPPLPISYSLKFTRTADAIPVVEDQIRDAIRIALGNNRLVPTEVSPESHLTSLETPYVSIAIDLMDEGRYLLEISCFTPADRRGPVSREPITSQTSRATARGPMGFGMLVRQEVVEQAKVCVRPLTR